MKEKDMKYKACQPFKDTLELRCDIIASCLRLSELGFCIGTWGNISVRIDDGLLITPSRIDYQVMKPEDMVVVSWEGRQIRGSRIPSSETELHRALLLKRPDFGALIHTHSPYASSLAAARQNLPVCLEDMAQIIGGTVNCTPYVPGGRHQELADSACNAIGPEAMSVLLANHGSIVGGKDLAEALVASQVLEKAAQIHVLSRNLGGAKDISPEYISEERHRYLYKYGKENPVEPKEVEK